MSSTQNEAILQVRIRAREDKQHAERLYDAMGTSLAEAVRLFVAQEYFDAQAPLSAGRRALKTARPPMDCSKHMGTPIAAPGAMPGLNT